MHKRWASIRGALALCLVAASGMALAQQTPVAPPPAGAPPAPPSWAQGMRDYKTGQRSGLDGMMTSVLHGVTDEQLVELAAYLSRLP